MPIKYILCKVKGFGDVTSSAYFLQVESPYDSGVYNTCVCEVSLLSSHNRLYYTEKALA